MSGKKRLKGNLSLLNLFAVLIAAIITLFFLPGFNHPLTHQLQELKSARAELELIKNRRTTLEALLDNKADYELKWNDIKEEAELHQKQLPPLCAQTRTIAGLEKILTSMPGEIRRLTVGPLVHSDHYSSLTLQLVYAGTPLQVEELLKAIENFSAILVIESLRYNLSEISRAELNLDLKLYFSNEPGINMTNPFNSGSFFTGENSGE